MEVTVAQVVRASAARVVPVAEAVKAIATDRASAVAIHRKVSTAETHRNFLKDSIQITSLKTSTEVTLPKNLMDPMAQLLQLNNLYKKVMPGGRDFPQSTGHIFYLQLFPKCSRPP